MAEWKLPTYTQARDEESATEDDGTLLPDTPGSDEDSEHGEKGEGDDSVLGSRKSIKSTVWMVLMVMATLTGRRILNNGFRESPLLDP